MDIMTINYKIDCVSNKVKKSGVSALYDKRIPEYRENKTPFVTQDVDLILMIVNPTSTTIKIPLDLVVAMSLRKVVVMTDDEDIIYEIQHEKKDMTYISEKQPCLLCNKYKVDIQFGEPNESYITDIRNINSLLYKDSFYRQIEYCRKINEYFCLERIVADNPLVFRNGEFAFVDKDGNLNVRFDESSFIERNAAMTSGSIDSEVEKYEYIIVRIGDSIIETFQTESIMDKNTDILNPYRLVVYHDEFCNLHAKLIEVYDDQFRQFKSEQIEMEERRRKREEEEKKRKKEEEERRRKEQEEKKKRKEEERRKKEEEKKRRLEEESEEERRRRESRRKSQRKHYEKRKREQKEGIEIERGTNAISNVLVLDDRTSDYWEYRSHLTDEENSYYGWENDPQ